MKQCSKCKEGKDGSEFYKDRDKKDGLRPDCKKCANQKQREYDEDHREEISQKDRKYHGNHREERNQKDREYYGNNREEQNQKQKERKNSPLPYDSELRQELEKYEKVRESENGNTECKCAYEGDGFEPTRRQIEDRLNAINGNGSEGAEHRLYCSNKCKLSCPIYKKEGYERGYEPNTSREVQPALRKMVFARDNYTCQDCNTHKDDLEVGLHCHHNEGVQGNPLESADVDKCKTLCKNCHDEFHSQPGYTYKDYQCPPRLKYNT